MYLYTDNYDNIVRWKNNKIVKVVEIKHIYTTYYTLDELICSVRQDLIDRLHEGSSFIDGETFYAVEINDTTREFIKAHKFEVRLDIKEVE